MARQALFLLLTLAHGAQLGMQRAAAQQGPSCNTFYTPGGQEEHDANDVEAKAGLVPLEDTLKEPFKSKIWNTRPWRTHFVIVTGHVGEFDRHIPAWMVHIASHPKFSFYVYQRSQPSEPRYSPNRCGGTGGLLVVGSIREALFISEYLCWGEGGDLQLSASKAGSSWRT